MWFSCSVLNMNCTIQNFELGKEQKRQACKGSMGGNRTFCLLGLCD
jgi:hypothetical protein